MARKSTPKRFAEPKAPYNAPRSGPRKADKVAKGKRKLPPPGTLPDGTVRNFLVVGPKGRVLLPADMRADMDVAEGDVLTAWLKDGEMRVHSHLHGLRRVQTEASSTAKPGVYASDELIAERRAEAAQETEDTLPLRRDVSGKRR